MKKNFEISIMKKYKIQNNISGNPICYYFDINDLGVV